MRGPTVPRSSVTADAPAASADTARSPLLEVPAEPVELRARIAGEVLGGADWEERFGPGLGVGEALWPQWAPALEAHGLERADFDAVVRAYRRELWFWALGERTWEQAASGLAGRLLRRLPAG